MKTLSAKPQAKAAKKPTAEHREAMNLVRNGADVTSYALAGTLRDVERMFPEYITICSVMGTYGVRDKLPYFGAILTAAGKAALDIKATT